MFVTVTFQRAKPGEEDAIIALHEDWQRHLLAKAKGYKSSELLSDPATPGSFISIVHYENEDAWRETNDDPEQSAWYERLLSLVSDELVMIKSYQQWQAERDFPIQQDVQNPTAMVNNKWAME
jgi:antibiotic biosynthesis monooxygenase (ABM) superfamily enzyme